jgi:zinc transport system substrate-binding protein
MAYRYDIQFVTVHGLDPEGEPSPEDLAKVIEHIEEEDITVLYIEEYTDASSVDSIVEATGVTVKILYTMEMSPKNTDDDYLTLMQKNFENLEAGMSCSA